MPSKNALNVSLTEELCDFVTSQVASGRYRTASEVVRAALRALERDLAEGEPDNGAVSNSSRSALKARAHRTTNSGRSL